MLDQFSRTKILFGEEAMERLSSARVAVFGVGGVGGACAEALARSGVGALDLIDDDLVCLTNVNRQIIATTKTVGQKKVDVMKERIEQINPKCKVRTFACFCLPQTAEQFNFAEYDYVVDAVDTVTAKLHLIETAHAADTHIISCMGAANKLDPTAFEVAGIYDTSICPLAKTIRKECRKRGIEHLKVVYSKEPALTPLEDSSSSCAAHCICPPEAQRHCTDRRSIPGSVSFVPPVAGYILAGEVIKDLIAHPTKQ